SEVLAWTQSPTGRKAVRYSAVSAISIAVSSVVLFVTYGILRVGSATECNVIATAVAAVPSYYLNRKWAWGRTGASHLWREVVPFWVVAFIGLMFSIWAVRLAVQVCGALHLEHLATSVVVDISAFGSYGVLWVAKFGLFNRWLFVDRSVVRSARSGLD
ncbi:MAG: GtrA family protein, partial [Actinomycetota bacterium]|nr:GtrA family protein [Actinomycetota bacterium]